MAATFPVAPERSASVRPSSFRAWVLAARPKTLTAALSPVLVGAALALHKGHFDPIALGLCLVGAILLQVASNFANDVFDFEKGADTAERLGPARAVQSGWLTPREMRVGLGVVLALGLAVGAALAWHVGPIIVAIGLSSIVAALAYTGGPFPLGYHGLGDVFVLAFFGLVAVLGTEHSLGSSPDVLSWLFAVALGGLSTNLLVVNNIRDRETDVRAGKRTLAVRFGRSFAELEFALFLLVAYAVPIAAVLFLGAGFPVLLPYLSLPLAMKNIISLRKLSGRALNPLLGGVAGLLFLYALLSAVGLAMSQRGAA